MDGEFACPKCGEHVSLSTVGAGRQVRCTSCNTLVEVPFLPRVEGDWKRLRFGRPWWWIWAWWVLALTIMGLVAYAAVVLILHGERAARVQAITRLLDSSRSHEAEGRLDLAMLDLDTAIQSAANPDDFPEAPDAIRDRRRDLALRDARTVLAGLVADARGSSALGDWLNLVARAEADRDLAPLRSEVEAQFAVAVGRWLDALADRAEREPDPTTAFSLCLEGVDLAVHLPALDHDPAVRRFREIAVGLVGRSGVRIEAAPGEYVRGTAAGYTSSLGTTIAATLGTKGFLPPPPPSSRWSELWADAPYRLVYTIRETFEGTYLGTENRLTRVDAMLVLSGPTGEVWKTSPNARSAAPVPNMPSYLAGRLALAVDRVDEAERILYDDAFSRIREKIRVGLAGMPSRAAVAGSRPH